MSSRLVSVFGFVVLSLSSIACYVQPGEGQEGGSTKSGAFGSKSGKSTSTNEAGGGSCDAACGHYLQCKDMDNTQNRATCTKNCEGMNLSQADLASYMQTECATAITMVEGNGQQGGGSSSGGSKSSACDGCVRDGNECVWISQGNWGSQNAYSGAVSTCDSSCCQ
jgi:hypothetical protein